MALLNTSSIIINKNILKNILNKIILDYYININDDLK